MNLQHLTSSEASLMQQLWIMDTFYLREVMEQHPEPKPHQNTVSTYLKILLEKGFLTKVNEGRIFKYSVAVSAESYREFLLKDLLNNYYQKDPQEILKYFLNHRIVEDENVYLEIFDLNAASKQQKEEPRFEIAEVILEDKKKKKKDKKKKKKKKKDDGK